MSKLANLNEEDLFEFDFPKKEIKLPISLFEEIEADLCDAILHVELLILLKILLIMLSLNSMG